MMNIINFTSFIKFLLLFLNHNFILFWKYILAKKNRLNLHLIEIKKSIY